MSPATVLGRQTPGPIFKNQHEINVFVANQRVSHEGIILGFYANSTLNPPLPSG